MDNIHFKLSPLGPIPEDWEVVRLGEVAQIRNGSRPIFKGNGNIPVYGSNGIMGWTDKHNVSGSLTLVIGRVGASGEVHLAKGNIWVSDNALFLILNPSEVSSEFLYYMLLKKNLRNLAAQSTHPLINQTTLKNLSIPFPPLPEQVKIAEVLRTVDEAIFKVEQEIEHTERLKRGLMQHLLTRGIGHTRFKDSPLGPIPEDWEVVRLGDREYFDLIMGQSPPSSTYNENGVGLPFLQGCAEFGKIYPKPVLYCSNPIKVAKPGDILISVRAPVGEINLVSTDICIGRGLAALRPNPQLSDIKYVFYALQRFKRRLQIRSSGSTFKAITKTDLEGFQIPLPPLPEQKRIAEILMTVDRKLELLRQKKEHLERLKKGLMNDLLTGRRRLKVGSDLPSPNPSHKGRGVYDSSHSMEVDGKAHLIDFMINEKNSSPLMGEDEGGGEEK